MHPTQQPQPAHKGTTRTAIKVAVWMAAFIVLFYVLREHWSHIAGNWIYLLLLACPLMHLFHGHGGHGHDHTQK